MNTQLEHLQKTTSDMRDALSLLNQTAIEFSSINNIKCKPGCGACCERPGDVWASIGEMLPMAWDIIERGDYDVIMREISSRAPQKMCSMFNPAEGRPGFGRCGEYQNRPSTCILFGASTTAKKDGTTRLLACSYLIDQKSKETQASLTASKIDARSLTEQVRSVIADNRLREERPINEALEQALELIAWARYTQKEMKFQACVNDHVPATSNAESGKSNQVLFP